MYLQAQDYKTENLIGSFYRRTILVSPRSSYAYKLSELEGYSRIDVAHAFMINLAQVYKDGRNHPIFEKQIPALVKAMDSSLVHIAKRGIPDLELERLKNKNDTIAIVGLAGKWSLISMTGDMDSNPSIREERAIFGSLEMPSSIGEYCMEELKANDPDYWPKVYSRIGLEYPNWYFQKSGEKVLDENISNSSMKSPSRKPYPLPKNVEDVLKGLSPHNQLKVLEKLKEIQLRDRSSIPSYANERKLNLSEQDEKPNQNHTSATLPKKKSNDLDKRTWQVKVLYTLAIILFGLISFFRLQDQKWDGPVDVYGFLAMANAIAYLILFAFRDKNWFVFLCVSCSLWIAWAIMQSQPMWLMLIPITTLSFTYFIIRRKWNGVFSEWDEMDN